MTSRDSDQDARDSQFQRLVWDSSSVSRDKICEALTLLGIDPDKARSVMMRPDMLEIEELVVDEEDRMQLSPDELDTVWTRFRMVPIT